MTTERRRSGDAELRQLLRDAGASFDVDVETALRAVESDANRKRRRRRERRSIGAVLAAAAAMVALLLGGRTLLAQPEQTPLTTTDGSQHALPDGTYRYRLTAHDLRTASRGRVSQQEITNNAGTWTWKVHNGHWSLHLTPMATTAQVPYPCAGTVTVHGDVATFIRTLNRDPVGDCAPPRWTARFTITHGAVRWSEVSVADFGWFVASEPWAYH